MRLRRFTTSLRMNFRMLMRRKIVLLLLTGIPCLFIMMVFFTSSDKNVIFQVGIAESKTMAQAREVHVALVFVSMATIGFLASFLSLNLVQQFRPVNRRLVFCGYKPGELLLTSLVVMVSMILVLVLCIAAVMLFFFQPVHTGAMIAGLLFTGLIYGSYGVLVGSIVNGELEGTFMVILLANIDAGWLQNPLFFAEARNKLIIQLLPAYHPSQIAIAASFTDLPVTHSVLKSLGYTIIILTFAMIIYYKLMKVKNHST